MPSERAQLQMEAFLEEADAAITQSDRARVGARSESRPQTMKSLMASLTLRPCTRCGHGLAQSMPSYDTMSYESIPIHDIMSYVSTPK